MNANFLSPITSRALNIEYQCAAPVREIPIPELVCESEAGTATLCGFSEYADASVPPKKYKKQVLSGEGVACYRTGVCGQGGGFGNVNRVLFDGESSYDPDASCGTLAANTQRVRQYNYGGGPNLCVANNLYSTVQPLTNPFSPYAATGNIWWDQGMAFTQSKTQKRWTNGCSSPNGTPPLTYSVYGDVTATLTEEDTEADAMLRVVSVPGNECTASHEARTAGDFSFEFQAVAYTMNVSVGLIPGKEYKFVVDLVEENYGGGSPVTTEKTYLFTAVDTSHSIEDVIDCPRGKQVTVGNLRLQPQ